MVNVVNAVPLNALPPIFVTLAGMESCVIGQLLNAEEPISVTDSGMVNDESDVQPLNIWLGITFQVALLTIVLRLVQP